MAWWTRLDGRGDADIEFTGPLQAMPTEAREWSFFPPSLAAVQTLASALGVNGTAAPPLTASSSAAGRPRCGIPIGGIPGWRFETGPCAPSPEPVSGSGRRPLGPGPLARWDRRGVKRLAGPTALDFDGAVLCEPMPCRRRFVVAGVRLG